MDNRLLPLELLAPAGSGEALAAAVQCGADAVYLGGPVFNARGGAENFAGDALYEAVGYAKSRGVRVYAALNTLVRDRELYDALRLAADFIEAGADALIVQDLGLAALLRRNFPSVPLHASTQLSVHNAEGARRLAGLGFTRVIPARELTLEDIGALCREAPAKVEVFAHGALCMCYSGQCYMSALLGGRSGNRGVCAQPCRLEYELDGRRGFLLSLKELCLAEHLESLARAGVAAIKLEGRRRRPEYVAAVTDIYARVLRGMGQEGDRERLATVFSRDGFTDGYLTGRTGPSMFGVRREEDVENSRRQSGLARSLVRSGHKYPRIPVSYRLTARPGQPAILRALEEGGRRAEAVSQMPCEPAAGHALNMQTVKKALAKSGDTPFYLAACELAADKPVFLPHSALNAMRRETLALLWQDRQSLVRRDRPSFFLPPPAGLKKEPAPGLPRLEAEFRNAGQVPETLPDTVVRLWFHSLCFESLSEAERVRRAAQGRQTGMVLPRVVQDGERRAYTRLLRHARDAGVSMALCGNLGLMDEASAQGFELHGDFGLNLFNSYAAAEAGRLFSSVTLSFEAALSELSAMAPLAETGIIIYGHLPMMVFRNCLQKSADGPCGGGCRWPASLTDRRSARHIMLREFGCRCGLYNAVPLTLTDRGEWMRQGFSFGRLIFTCESAEQCADIILQAQQGKNNLTEYTRGLYDRGVQDLP